MSHYHETKKVRRIASVIYILVMIFIVTGTVFSEQQKAALKKSEQHPAMP